MHVSKGSMFEKPMMNEWKGRAFCNVVTLLGCVPLMYQIIQNTLTCQL